jgi:hypothetical protein
MSSAIQIYKKNPSPAEQRTSLINSSDGAGLHFDGAAGYIDIASPPDLGAKFSFEFVVKADAFGSDTRLLVDFGNGGRLIFGSDLGISYNLGIYDNTSWKSFGVKVVDDLKVHHLVATVDGTAATLYDNGNLVGTATISSSHNLDNCADAKIATNYVNTGGQFNGTIYRARFYNKALTSAEVQTAYERADVDFADQYGSQTFIIDSSFASSTQSFNGAGGTTAANIDGIGGQNDTLRFTTDSTTTNHQIVRVCPRDKGKNVRVQGMVYIPSSNTNLRKVQINENGNADVAVIKEITTLDAWVTFDEIHVWTDYDELRFRGLKADGTSNYAGNGSDVFYIKNIKVNNAGVVSDYDLAFANPTQSLTVQDRAGAADGTASSSTAVTQVQKLVQVNATSARIGTTAATPADGEIIATGVKAETYRSARSDGDIYIQAATASDFVAIGTQVSSNLLKVEGSGNVTVASGNVGVGDSTPTSPGGAARFVEISGSSASLVLTDSDAATWEWISAGGNLKAAKDGSDKFTIDANGAVGLARTATSGYRLDVHGRSGYDDVVLIEGNGTNMGPRINLTPTGTGTSRINATANDLALQTGGTSRLTIANDGAVDIAGAASGSPALTVGNSTGGTDLEITPTENASITLNASEGATARDLILATGGTPRLTVASGGLATFSGDVAYDDHARVYHGDLPSTGPSHSSHDKYNFNFTFSGTYGVALITLDIAAGIGEVAAGRYTLAVSCTANSGVTTQLMGSVSEVFKHNLSSLTFADSGSSNRTFTLSVERTVTAENWGTNTGSYKLEVTNNHRTLTLNSVTAST